MGKGKKKKSSSLCVFEGFAIETVRSRKIKALRSLVKEVLGRGWRVHRFGDKETDFEVTSRKRELTTAQAWNAAYSLRAVPGIVYAEPVFAIDLLPRASALPTRTGQQPLPEVHAEGAEGVNAADAMNIFSCFGGADIVESDDPEWSLKVSRVLDAWEEFFPDPNVLPGAGVVIAHPDTGFRLHPEIADRLLIDEGFDFVDDDSSAEDPLEGGFMKQPGHGTSTASVMVSPRGAQGNFSGDPSREAVTGVAPGAVLMPLRVTESVILNTLSTFNVARALEYAADHGAHVVSMSLGKGLPSFRLRKAINYALKRGVILCAAAGNCIGFVTWPAAYDEVIAAAGSNARGEIWAGSSRGSKVDVTAPGESVWRAHITEDGEQNVKRGSGTSYAIAIVAGIAALWLSHHGRDNLIQRYGAEKLPLVFNQILRSSCTPMPLWEPGKFGAGLVNARATLAATLPGGATEPLPVAAFALDQPTAIDKGMLDTFEHLFEESMVSRSKLSKLLAEILGITVDQVPTRLREVGQELAFHLTLNPDLYEQFATALAASGSEGPAISGARMGAREQLLSKDISGALRSPE